ncbi:MAG: deoxyribonuclease IV [Candidatus Micrarchaeaceae archaeon]
MMRFGFHMSIAGAVANSARSAALSGYGAFQIFTTSSRSWKHSDIKEDDAANFKSIVAERDISPNAHVPYLCNPSSPNAEIRKKSLQMLISNMRNCSALGIKEIVVHMGSHLGAGEAVGMRNLVSTVSEAIDSEGGVSILLENSAGYTNSIGSSFKDIGAAMKEIGSTRVGLCLDTCHAFAAGYDLTSQQKTKAMFSEISEYIGIKRLKLVHLNDAKFPLSSGLDRHWHIGKGFIGKKGFINLFSNELIRNMNIILETPVNSEGDDKSNYSALKNILKECNLLDFIKGPA